MTTRLLLSFLPTALAAALALPAAFPTAAPAGDAGLPAAGLPAAGLPALHPHPVRRMALKAVGGEVALTYRTVDFDAEHKAKIRPGMEWHMAFGTTLESAVPLTCGDVELAPGSWHVSTRVGADGETWQLKLEPDDAWRGLRTTARSLRGAGGEERAALEAKVKALRERLEQGTVYLPALTFASDPSDHMRVTLLDHGHEVDPRSGEPRTGNTFDVRVTFGDLTCGARLTEALPKRGR